MKNTGIKFFLLLLVSVFIVAGCATTKARHADEPNAQAQSLQAELQAKDQQIEDLQYQLDSYQQAAGSNYSSGSSSSSIIRVPGVTVKAVQKALSHAGLDPGPIDGKIGKKTKSAIKEFQRRNNLKADGVVGEKTWSLLK
jgi:peptidoglycan hydrolase-like protein with peptidoglycan-binding domain